MTERTTESLAAWQWNLYPHNHTDRRNLVVHVLTTPLFWAGTLAVVTSFVTSFWSALAGVVLMVAVVAIQGRTHALETTPPVPFRGPLDVLGRIFIEQWFTFPRYVVTGGFSRAWRAARGVAGP